MNTTENNKLIAEFLGINNRIETGNSEIIAFSKIEGFYKITDLKFHTDWNWLMEVVEKIESLKPIDYLSGRNWIGFGVTIYKTFNTQTHYCTIKYLKLGGDMTISNGFSKSNKIEAVYNACIEFIKWHNEK